MAVRTTRRHRRILSIFGSFAIVAALSTTPLMNAALQAGVDAGRDVLAMFGERSPGARPEGALLATKEAKAGMGPREYAKPRTRTRPEAHLPAGPAFADAAPIDGPVTPLGGIADVPDPVAFYSPPGGGIFPPGGGIIPPGGGGGILPPGGGTPPPGGGIIPPGGGGTPPGGPVPPTGSGGGEPPVPSAPVPEPAAWLTLIVGFGAVGVLLRRKRKTAASNPQPQSGSR